MLHVLVVYLLIKSKFSLLFLFCVICLSFFGCSADLWIFLRDILSKYAGMSLGEHGFKNRVGKRSGKRTGSHITGPTDEVINNLINNFKII
jgi:hypothetical protein